MIKTENTQTGTASDERLVVRVQQGDGRALESLYQSYYPRVYNRIRVLVPLEDVEDVTSEVFLNMVRSLHQFKGRSSFNTWLYTIVSRRVADYYRHRKSNNEEHIPVNADIDHPDFDFSVETKIAVAEVLQKLPEHYRQVLFLRFTDELSFQEIADKLSISQDAAKSLYRRAIASARGKIVSAGLSFEG